MFAAILSVGRERRVAQLQAAALGLHSQCNRIPGNKFALCCAGDFRCVGDSLELGLPAML